MNPLIPFQGGKQGSNCFHSLYVDLYGDKYKKNHYEMYLACSTYISLISCQEIILQDLFLPPMHE